MEADSAMYPPDLEYSEAHLYWSDILHRLCFLHNVEVALFRVLRNPFFLR